MYFKIEVDTYLPFIPQDQRVDLDLELDREKETMAA